MEFIIGALVVGAIIFAGLSSGDRQGSNNSGLHNDVGSYYSDGGDCGGSDGGGCGD